MSSLFRGAKGGAGWLVGSRLTCNLIAISYRSVEGNG
jgi:hypothetical protein